jgi:hypothetical protein
MDKNLLALISSNSVTVSAQFPSGNKCYTYIYTAHEGWPAPKVGQLVVVPAKYVIPADDVISSVNPANEQKFALVQIVAVDDCVNISPNSDLEYAYVAAPVDTTAWVEQKAKLSAVRAELFKAYRKHLVASYKAQLLESSPSEVKALLETITL